VTAVAAAHAASTLVMAGVVWTMQVVHYPLFSSVGRDGFTDYERRHTAAVTRLIAAPAVAEIITAAALFLARPEPVPAWLPFWSGALLAGVWVMTAAVQAPAHGRLGSGFDPEVHRRLVRSNWVRTAVWSLRGAAALWMLAVL